jgi:hypothetical protein
MCTNLTVVSDEINGSALHPKIPFVCGQLDPKIPHLRIVDFMRQTGLRL